MEFITKRAKEENVSEANRILLRKLFHRNSYSFLIALQILNRAGCSTKKGSTHASYWRSSLRSCSTISKILSSSRSLSAGFEFDSKGKPKKTHSNT